MPNTVGASERCVDNQPTNAHPRQASPIIVIRVNCRLLIWARKSRRLWGGELEAMSHAVSAIIRLLLRRWQRKCEERVPGHYGYELMTINRIRHRCRVDVAAETDLP